MLHLVTAKGDIPSGSDLKNPFIRGTLGLPLEDKPLTDLIQDRRMTGVPGRILFQARTGSHAYGLAGPDSDVDIRGIYQLPNEAFLGLDRPRETYEVPGEDTVYWELGHFCRMLLKGNPNIVEILWLPDGWEDVTSPAFEALRSMRSQLLTAEMTRAFLGWAIRERRRGDELDGKAASHLVRLLWELGDALYEGTMSTRANFGRARVLMEIKRGEWTPLASLTLIDALIDGAREAEAEKPLPPAPRELIAAFLADCRRRRCRVHIGGVDDRADEVWRRHR